MKKTKKKIRKRKGKTKMKRKKKNWKRTGQAKPEGSQNRKKPKAKVEMSRPIKRLKGEGVSVGSLEFASRE